MLLEWDPRDVETCDAVVVMHHQSDSNAEEIRKDGTGPWHSAETRSTADSLGEDTPWREVRVS